MKAQSVYKKSKLSFENSEKKSVLVINNNLKIKAWIQKGQDSGYYLIYAESPYFKENARVIMQNNELIILTEIKVEAHHTEWNEDNDRISYFNPGTTYYIIKSSKIFLPGDTKYNLVSYSILDEGLLLITIKSWNHKF